MALLNLASDPSARLNDLHFEKEILKENDVIRIGNSTIYFHIIAPSLIPFASVTEGNSHQSEIDPLVLSNVLEPIDPPLKNYYFGEYEDHDIDPLHHISSAGHAEEIRSWYGFLRCFAAFASIAAVCGGIVYLWMSDKIEAEEIQAARLISDVTMALSHAQLKGIYPQNQNWSDIEFIKHNLVEILPSFYTSSSIDFDRQGHFLHESYALRIYASPNLTQFLVIAQPLPGFIDHVIPRASIVIDSYAMEIHKILELKVLNRLLVNANALEEVNAAEISSLVAHGKLIPLSELASSRHLEFLPPKELSLNYPEAKDLVYNAPRYHFFGNEVIKQALGIIQVDFDESSVAVFMRELSLLNRFPNLVLYSTGGIHAAIEARHALKVLAPEENFFFGYLETDNKGSISDTQLLLDDLNSEIALQEPPPGFMLEKSLYNVLAKSNEKMSAPWPRQSNENQLRQNQDGSHPIFLHLSGLSAYRERMLKPICNEISFLFEKHSQCLNPNFQDLLTELEYKYIQADQEQLQEIEKHISTILKENPSLPASSFIEFVRAAHMETVFDHYLKSIQEKAEFTPYSQESADELLKENFDK